MKSVWASGTGVLRATLNWRVVVPCLGLVTLYVLWGSKPAGMFLAVAAVLLVALVLTAVQHAEALAHRFGEPFGTLVLALSVTLIEVSLIVSMMVSEQVSSTTLARDTVFSTVMIVCNGTIGLCLLLGSLKHRTLGFKLEGTTAALSVLITLTTLTLVLPDFTFTTAVATFSTAQLVFCGIVSLLLYGVFIFVQTVRHRDYFLSVPEETANEIPYTARLSAFWSFILLLLSLVAVVGLAEFLAPAIEGAFYAVGLPNAALGVAIALLILLPETLAAIRCALRGRAQDSFNLALGSALATIGLTIPAVVFSSILLDIPISLGLPPKEITMLALTLLLTSTTLAAGRATLLHGSVHLVVFLVFIFLTIVP